MVAPLYSEAHCVGVGAGRLRVSEGAVPCAFLTHLLFIFPLCLCVGFA